jgi:hypothetical protein
MKRAILTLICIVGLASMANNGNYYKQLKRELLVIWNEDQDIRNQYIKAREKLGESDPKVENIAKIMRYKDSIHLVKVSKILDEEGWIGKDKIGQLANNTLFLVIQHSDLKTQQKYLPMMRNAVKEGKTELSWLVLLEDRVALREGRKQIYGSHVFGNKETKKNYVAPLDDPDNVDKRRSEVGLEPMANYLKKWNIIWNVEEYKKQLPEIEKLYTKEIPY